MANSEAEISQTGDPALFDAHGRRIPPRRGADIHQEIRRRFTCTQPAIDYSAIHTRIARHMGVPNSISVAEFAARGEAILGKIRDHASISGILDGVRVPFFLPQADNADIGRAMEEIYLKATRSAFGDMFPNYAFVNHHSSSLEGKLGIAPGSRHERLIEAMRKSDVVGFYFPCLLAYSIPAAIEQMDSLPALFSLAGGFDTCAAFTGSPDLLMKTDEYPPLLWLAALTGEREGIAYHFEAYGYNLTFNRRAHLGQAAEYWASGLVALG